MHTVLHIVEGPLFRIAILLLILGVLRLVLLGARPVAPRSHSRVHRIASILLHLGVIAVPLFHDGHVALWAGGRLSLPAMPAALSDLLTIATIAGVVGILWIRRRSPSIRARTDRFDYGVLLLIGACFLSGWFTTHPETSPLPWEGVRLLHALTANALIILIPFTRLCHLTLEPRMRAEVAA